MRNKLLLVILPLLGHGFYVKTVANVVNYSTSVITNEDNKKVIILIGIGNGQTAKNEKDGNGSGRTLEDNIIFAELHNGILSFSPYNIIGETFVLRIYDKEEEDVLWQKVCRYSELNNIILPNLPADTYVMTFETNEGVFATDIAL